MPKNESILAIQSGKTALGIELGSTRIKAVLVDLSHRTLASGSFAWENQLKNGIWTYELADALKGLQNSYTDLCRDVEARYGIALERIGAIGISGMMHGYLAFDESGNLLAPFRTWRNTNAEEAGRQLTEMMQFNIPIRWSIAQLYQSVLEGQEHVSRIRYLTTLAGYIHWKLTGEQVLGVGDASGMFPIDSKTNTYDAQMLSRLDEVLAPHGYGWKTRDILPRVLVAGDDAGMLTEEGARLLDASGRLKAGIPMVAPEGDAGTGMVATDSVAPRTGNVSAGTSIFAMLVLEKPLSRMYPEIDMVTTPSGWPVAMVHCNNCTSDLDAWVRVFRELLSLAGSELSTPALFDRLYEVSLQGEPDCGGVVVYNYLSGEPITGLSEGRPMVVRNPNGSFTLGNLMRAQLYSTMAVLRIGMEILYREGATIDHLMGHGGLFKTPHVGQKLMADAMGFPVSVMETAGEGGAYGIAVLAAYTLQRDAGESLEHYLEMRVFSHAQKQTVEPEQNGIDGFQAFLNVYKRGLAAERAAVESIG